ncbi:MAG TPA: glucoamylase family protein, partial [Flexilinea sp.]|nr:glucoamylase family protein [Flexilinea sp.]
FEYLMPALFFHSYPATLLAESSEGAVLRQIEYGKEKGVPWGISESGFYRFDASQNYQYRAFGVPGLGFKRGLADDLVIAPYASLMAVSYEPEAVVQNLVRLLEYKMFGLFGLYEAIDFTPDRLLKDERSALVYEYMAHHQGMIMMAMANFFANDIMVQRLHRDSRIQSVELLLQEQIPYFVPIQNPDAENVEGLQRMVAVSEEIAPWRVPLLSTIPQLNLLSNGSYHLLISNMGGGYSSMNAVDLTRWRADQVTDSWGTWIYIQEMDSNSGQPGRFWSATYQPVPGDPTNLQVTYYAHMAVFRRSENGFISTMDVTVAPDDPVEIRRIHLMNTQDDIHTLRLTSYGEVILSSQLTDVRHPAFNKMFIESEFIPELNLQIFTRRLRSDQEKSIFLGHMVLTKGIQKTVSHEADRYHFIGRGGSTRNPIALSSEQYLSGTTGATLDPIFSLGQEVELLPHGSTDLAFLTFTAESREELLILADRYRNWAAIETAFSQANIAAKAWLGKL